MRGLFLNSRESYLYTQNSCPYFIKGIKLKKEDLPPTVFISYSWDSGEHKYWVKELAERLVSNGVKVFLDIWEVAPGESLTQFMERSIKESNFVLVICTPNYAQKSDERQGGVGYEQQIISGQLMNGIERKQLIPILKNGTYTLGKNCAIPSHFQGIMTIDFSTSKKETEYFENLLRAIFEQPLHAPLALGKRPEFGNNKNHTDVEFRLPNIILDGYEIESGVVSNLKYPDTFHIPSPLKRNTCKKDEIVKINFGISLTRSPDDVEYERMWVKIIDRKGPYFLGELDNDPICSEEENEPLTAGDQIVFLPEHIIDIYPEE